MLAFSFSFIALWKKIKKVSYAGMSKMILFLLLVLMLAATFYYFIPRYSKYHLPSPTLPQSTKRKKLEFEKINARALEIRTFIDKNSYSKNFCFLLDMNLPSGRNRFFIYDLNKKKIVEQGLVAHGSCNTAYLETAKFSNTPNCGCSSVGRYKIGNPYHGRFGKAYKLYGLDSTNSNAFKRNIVLHGYECISDNEVYPQPVCNSLGCPMVSFEFLNKAGKYIEQSKKPILLWIF